MRCCSRTFIAGCTYLCFVFLNRHLRTVSTEEAMEFAEKHNLAFIEVKDLLHCAIDGCRCILSDVN